MLLDTTFLIDLMRNSTKAVKKLKDLEEDKIPQNMASPTLYELFVGITLSSKPELEKRKVLETLTSVTTLNLDAKSAVKAGRIQGRLIKEGEMIDPEDAMVAGIALVNKETLLTRNMEHFSRISELEIESY